MILERHQLLELDALLGQLLGLKDADFTKFLNNSEALKPFFTCLQGFWSTATTLAAVDELSLTLHEKVFKFLLRLCPSFNRKLPKNSTSTVNNLTPLRAVICPKKVIDCLFDSDPLGLLCYLYETWHPNELLDVIRDELIPNDLMKHSVFKSGSSDSKCNEFTKWLTRNTFNGALKTNERYRSAIN